ncbi:MAG: hypothetical protein ACK583_13835 [Cyanobacteriota bacterium]|jgi:hypothetical protein
MPVGSISSGIANQVAQQDRRRPVSRRGPVGERESVPAHVKVERSPSPMAQLQGETPLAL